MIESRSTNRLSSRFAIMVDYPLIVDSKGESRGAGVLEHGQWSLGHGSRLMVGADPRAARAIAFCPGV
jgi:hypothetical protein